MFLGLDIGTTNVKALVVDANGRPLGRGSSPVELFHPGAGGVEQDIEQIWSGVCSAVRQSLSGLNASAVEAVGISSQGGALQVVSADDQPVGRVISWLDQRAAKWNSELTDKRGPEWFADRIGHSRAGLAIGQLLRLAAENPRIIARPNRIRFVGDMIVHRLTGRAAQDGTSAALTLLYNPSLRNYDPDVLQELGISDAQLPDLAFTGQPAGSLSMQASLATGLPEGIPVSAAAHDQYAAALAARAVESGVTMLGTGTVWVLLAVGAKQDRPVAPNAFVCHHLVEGLHGQILSMVNGGSSLSWVLGLCGINNNQGQTIDEMLQAVPPGSDGVCFWPFLAPSDPPGITPGTGGRFSGLRLSHTGAHLARAALEGLGFELRRHLSLLERAGIVTRKLVLSGAAASGTAMPQLLAELSGLPLSCASESGSALGAAIIARGLKEPGNSLAAIAKAMTPPCTDVPPGPNAGFYADRFADYMQSLPLNGSPLS